MQKDKKFRKWLKKKLKNNTVRIIIYCFLLLFGTEMICFVSGSELAIDVGKREDSRIKDVVEACGNRFETRISEYMDIINIAAKSIPDTKNLENGKNQEVIKELGQVAYIQDAYLVDMNYQGIGYQGDKKDFSDNEVIERIYQSGKEFQELKIQKNKDNVVYMGTPIRDGNNKVVGAVFISVKTSLFSNEVAYGLAIGEGHCFLTDKDGNVLDYYAGKADTLDGIENIMEYLEPAKFSYGNDYLALKNDIQTRRTDSTTCSLNDKELYVCYAPVKGLDSYAVVIYDKSYAYYNYENIYKNLYQIMKLIALGFLVFCIVIVINDMVVNLIVKNRSKELEEKAELDGLTTLYNKMATEKYIRNYLESEGKDQNNLLFIIDVDHFKEINDTKGHTHGDEVLSMIGREIGSEFRVTDIIGRVGGDEFVVFLKNIPDREVAQSEAQRLIDFFHSLHPGEYVKSHVTASIGGAMYPEDGDDYESLYRAADSAVYKAKQRGRDQFAFYVEDENAISVQKH